VRWHLPFSFLYTCRPFSSHRKNSSQARWHTGTSDTDISEDLGLDDDVVNEIYNANLDSNNDGAALCNLGVDDDE